MLIFVDMKRISIVLFAALIVMSVACASQSKTFVVNTEKMGQEVMGYAGKTPVEIHVVDGRIEKIVALPNSETPVYFQKVVESPIFTVLVGKTVKEATEVQLDAVSGATWSSKAVIENIRLGLKAAGRKVR